MSVRFRIQVDKRYSALLDLRWLQRCGYTRRQAYRIVVSRYGWPNAQPV